MCERDVKNPQKEIEKDEANSAQSHNNLHFLNFNPVENKY